MTAKPTKVYPVKGHYLSGVPRVVTIVSTKGEAEELVASGAFTDNPNDPDRDHDVEDSSEAYAEGSPVVVGEKGSEPVVNPEVTSTKGENPEDEPEPASVPPSDGNTPEENG